MTLHSSIIPMITERRYASNPIVCTVENTTLISSAAQIIQPDWSSCATIVGIEVRDRTLEKQYWKMKHLASTYIYSCVKSNALQLPNVVYPSCLQITVASRLSQLRSQILPQVRLTHTWTVPFLTVPFLVVDPIRRTLPSVQLSGTIGANRCGRVCIIIVIGNVYPFTNSNEPT